MLAKKTFTALPVILTVLLFVFTLGGCGSTASSGVNPYVLLTNVNQINHTPFFIETYITFLRSGFGVTTTTDQTTQTTTTTTNTNTTDYLSSLTGMKR